MTMKENQCTEWKESWNDDYMKWICAFANTQGGSLCIGINDNGKIIPLKDEKKLLEDLPNKIRDVLGIIADVHTVSTENGDYIRIKVPAHSHLVSFRGHFYYRSGSTTQELKGPALERMILKKNNISWDSVTVPGVKVEELSNKAFELFKKSAVAKKRMPESFLGESNLSILKNLKLFRNGELTRAAILLFHPDPEEYIFGSTVKVGFFRSSSTLVHQDEFSGSLFELLANLRTALDLKYLKAYISFKGFQRVEEYLFPEEALREGILNALVHKDYSRGIPIQIKIFEDKLLIYNNGVMPEEWTIKDLLDVDHDSHPYNPLLASTFYKAGEIESWGTGVKRITEACSAGGIAAPKYRFSPDSGFCLTLDGTTKLQKLLQTNITEFDSESKGKSKGKRKGKSKDKILEAIIANAKVTIPDLAKLTGLSIGGVEKNLRELKLTGKIERKGKRGGHWIIK